MTSPYGPYFARVDATADLGPGDRAGRLAALTSALTGAGVALGDFDQDVAAWLAGSDPATIQAVIGWITRADSRPAPVSPAGTWAIYRPTPADREVLEATGIHGTWSGYAEPDTLAGNVLETYADANPDWVVNVYGPDALLVAWAEWDGGKVAVHRAAAKVVQPR
jgi:hypothetical protein